MARSKNGDLVSRHAHNENSSQVQRVDASIAAQQGSASSSGKGTFKQFLAETDAVAKKHNEERRKQAGFSAQSVENGVASLRLDDVDRHPHSPHQHDEALPADNADPALSLQVCHSLIITRLMLTCSKGPDIESRRQGETVATQHHLEMPPKDSGRAAAQPRTSQLVQVDPVCLARSYGRFNTDRQLSDAERTRRQPRRLAQEYRKRHQRRRFVIVQPLRRRRIVQTRARQAVYRNSQQHERRGDDRTMEVKVDSRPRQEDTWLGRRPVRVSNSRRRKRRRGQELVARRLDQRKARRRQGSSTHGHAQTSPRTRNRSNLERRNGASRILVQGRRSITAGVRSERSYCRCQASANVVGGNIGKVFESHFVCRSRRSRKVHQTPNTVQRHADIWRARYLKTTLFGLTATLPDFVLLIIGGNAGGLIGMSKVC